MTIGLVARTKICKNMLSSRAVGLCNNLLATPFPDEEDIITVSFLHKPRKSTLLGAQLLFDDKKGFLYTDRSSYHYRFSVKMCGANCAHGDLGKSKVNLVLAGVLIFGAESLKPSRSHPRGPVSSTRTRGSASLNSISEK